MSLLLLLLQSCDTPAALYPVDPCRLGENFADVTAEVSCTGSGGALDASFAWHDDTRTGGTRGESWDGLSFYATGTSAGGGTLSVGQRPGSLGLYALEHGVDARVGFIPSSADLPEAPYVTISDATSSCDAQTGSGSVRLSGLPDSWVEGGVWEMQFDAGTFDADPVNGAWAAPWPATCPINPRSWASIGLSASCGGEVLAAIDFLSPATYTVELDEIGQVSTVAATWDDAFSARCAGGALPHLDGSLQGTDGALRLYTPVLTAVRTPGGEWSVEASSCGSCDAWVIEVEGLPAL